jgi:LDH2 family malate/lactate/ureidoglycolate dehydrogenase
MTEQPRHTAAEKPVLTLSDIVVATGRVDEEKLILRGLDLTVTGGETLCIVYDNRTEAQALADMISGKKAPTSGHVVRDSTRPVVVDWNDSDQLAAGPVVVFFQATPGDGLPFSRVLKLVSGRLLEPAAPTWEPVAPDRLERAAAACLCALGVNSDTARLVACVLVDADRRGHASHGIGLLPTYIERIRQGGILLDAEPAWDWQTETMASIDCKGAIGQLGAQRAVDWVTAQARSHGVAMVAVHNNNHVGMMAAYRQSFQRNGVMGLLTNISGTSVTPSGGTRLSLGSNALCLVTPRVRSNEPFCIDMASGVVAAGKVREAAAFGRSIPGDWLLDSTGQPSQDPNDLEAGGMIPVFGGYKGLGIHLILELLAGVLAAGMTSARVHKQRKEFDTPMQCSQFFVAIDPARFGHSALDDYITELEQMVVRGYDSQSVPDIHFPDQQEAKAVAHAAAQGILISPEVQKCLQSYLDTTPATAGADQ